MCLLQAFTVSPQVGVLALSVFPIIFATWLQGWGVFGGVFPGIEGSPLHPVNFRGLGFRV